MDTKIILIYCLCSDFLRKIKHHELSSETMTDAEVLTFTIVSAMFFYGSHEKARNFMREYGYITQMLSKSQLNRRIHRFDESFWRCLLHSLSTCLLRYETCQEYAIDSFPVSVCDTSRITRAKIFQGKEYHSYSSTKQRYYYGIKVHMLVSADKGVPIEILFTPGSEHDMKAFKRFSIDIPEGSVIYGDKAYTDYEFEDFLMEHAEIQLIAQRRRNSRRPLRAELRYLQSRMRKRIETVFSQITGIFPRKIHAVTSKGFEIKVFNFILAYTFDMLFRQKLTFA